MLLTLLRRAVAGSSDGTAPKMSVAEMSFRRDLERNVAKKATRTVASASAVRWAGSLLLVFTVSIYVYTVTRMKKETFLEDFEPLEDPRAYAHANKPVTL